MNGKRCRMQGYCRTRHEAHRVIGLHGLAPIAIAPSILPRSATCRRHGARRLPRAGTNELGYDRAVMRQGENFMTTPVEEFWSMPEPALIGAYESARRQFVEKKFARDTQRARLEWMRAKMFVGSFGGGADLMMVVDVLDDLCLHIQ